MDTFTVGLVLFGAAMFGLGALAMWVYMRALGWPVKYVIDRSLFRLHDPADDEYPEITPQ